MVQIKYTVHFLVDYFFFKNPVSYGSFDSLLKILFKNRNSLPPPRKRGKVIYKDN